MNVLAKDGSMKIQVGANDGQTITIDLKKIDSSTLNLTGFNVNGSGSVANTAATKADLTAAQLSAPSAADANGTVTYTVSAGYKESTAADVIASIKDGSAPTSAITATINNGFGDSSALTSNDYTYDSVKATSLTT